MIYISQKIAYISKFMTLEKEDHTSTPAIGAGRTFTFTR